MISKRFKYDSVPCIKLNNIQINAKRNIEQKIKNGIYSYESKDCPICSSKSFFTLSEKDRYGLPMSVCTCRKCGLVQTNPRMDQDSYNSFYENDQKLLYTSNKEPTRPYFDKQVNRGEEIYSLINKYMKKGTKILEIGCSSGGILKFFKEIGYEIYGCDVNSEYISYGINNHNLSIVKGSINEINIPWKPDVVIYSHTLEHILNPENELRKVRGISHDNTLLYVELPGIRNLWRSYGRDFLEYLQGAHVYHYSLKTLRNLMRKSGWCEKYGDEYIRMVSYPCKISNSIESDVSVVRYLKIMNLLRYLPTPYRIRYLFKKWKN